MGSTRKGARARALLLLVVFAGDVHAAPTDAREVTTEGRAPQHRTVTWAAGPWQAADSARKVRPPSHSQLELSTWRGELLQLRARQSRHDRPSTGTRPMSVVQSQTQAGMHPPGSLSSAARRRRRSPSARSKLLLAGRVKSACHPAAPHPQSHTPTAHTAARAPSSGVLRRSDGLQRRWPEGHPRGGPCCDDSHRSEGAACLRGGATWRGAALQRAHARPEAACR